MSLFRCGFNWSIFTILLVLSGQIFAQEDQTRPRNIIFMIGDGFGPTAVTAAREYYGQLSLDEILVGTVQTRSHSHAVTDSAAGATAFATGVRTDNRAVSVSPDKKPLRTLLQEAKAKGMATGLIATSPIAHATPAAFSAHAEHRKLMFDIALQQSNAGIDLLLGGGYEDWLPKAKGGCRIDGKDLLKKLKSKGYHTASYKNDRLQIPGLPAIGLFAKGNLDYMIDHNDKSGPELKEMTAQALALLSKKKSGFFLMIEGSRIDHAGHDNDPASKLHEIKAYDETVKLVLDFAKRDGQTLLISVSDHETGGMSLGRDDIYNWRPEVLRKVTASSTYMAKRIIKGDKPVATFLKYSGLKKNQLSRSEQKKLIQLAKIARKAQEKSCSGKWLKKNLAKMKSASRKPHSPEKQLRYWISRKISKHALVGWTTFKHTGVDVNLYAYGPSHELLRGNHKNTHIAKVIADVMDFRKVQKQIKLYSDK